MTRECRGRRGVAVAVAVISVTIRNTGVIGGTWGGRYPIAVHFEVLIAPVLIERIAIGRRVRDIRRLRQNYGAGRWRKLKGVALVRVSHGAVFWAELHWYEADGIGRREMKIKRLLDESQ